MSLEREPVPESIEPSAFQESEIPHAEPPQDLDGGGGEPMEAEETSSVFNPDYTDTIQKRIDLDLDMIHSRHIGLSRKRRRPKP